MYSTSMATLWMWINSLLEAMAMDIEIPWLKRFEEERDDKPDEIEVIDYETMLEELEYR